MELFAKKRNKEKKEASLSDLLSCCELIPFKRFMNNQQEYLELKDYGYMQMLEINGKDIYSMGEAEEQRTLLNFYDWLTQFTDDFEIETTTLPTNTDSQISNMRNEIRNIRQEMRHCRNERIYKQLEDREKILLNNIQTEDLIKDQMYNTEFILMLYAENIADLDIIVQKSKAYGNGDFVPRELTLEKKEQILKQYHNMNEKV